MILDTSFILDLWADQPDAVAKARQIDAHGEPVYIPTPVLFELWEGVARSERPRAEAAKVLEFAGGHELLPFGDTDAREAGVLSGHLSRSGRMMGTVDVQIAGMAKARAQALLATDRRFRDLASEIRIEKYP
jgi:predicted nucleic acid-binding protein